MIKLRKRKTLERSIEITPLIDIVFILLIFFLLTAVYVPYGLNLDLPEANTAQKQEETPLYLTITQGQEILLNEKVISLDQLKTNLASLKGKSTITIQGDQSIAYGLFVKVMDVIRQSGAHGIVLAAELPQPQF